MGITQVERTQEVSNMKRYRNVYLQYDSAGRVAFILRPGGAKCPKVVNPPGTAAPDVEGHCVESD